MHDWNESIRSLNVGLPDDIARLKAAGYYQEAIARIDRLLAEDWTKTQTGPASNGIAPPEEKILPKGICSLLPQVCIIRWKSLTIIPSYSTSFCENPHFHRCLFR